MISDKHTQGIYNKKHQVRRSYVKKNNHHWWSCWCRGHCTPTRLRRLNEEAHIILFEKGSTSPFGPTAVCLTSVGGVKEREDLLLQTVEGMNSRTWAGCPQFLEVTASTLGKNGHSPT